jgi:hypothetical protein
MVRLSLRVMMATDRRGMAGLPEGRYYATGARLPRIALVTK